MNLASWIIVGTLCTSIASIYLNAYDRVCKRNTSMELVSDQWRAKGYWVHMRRRRWFWFPTVLVIDSVSAHHKKYGPIIAICDVHHSDDR